MPDEVMCPILSLLGAEKVCKKELCAWYVDAELSETGNSGCAIIMAAFALDTIAHEEAEDDESEEVDEGDGDDAEGDGPEDGDDEGSGEAGGFDDDGLEDDGESSGGDYGHNPYEGDGGIPGENPDEEMSDEGNAGGPEEGAGKHMYTQEEVDDMLEKAGKRTEGPEYESNNGGTPFPVIQKPLTMKKTEVPEKAAFLHDDPPARAAKAAETETPKPLKPLTAQQITEKSKHIVKAVSKVFKFRRALILSTVKSGELYRARHAIAYFTRKLLDFPDEAIEKLLNLEEGKGIEYFRSGVRLLNSGTHGKRMESIEWNIKNSGNEANPVL